MQRDLSAPSDVSRFLLSYGRQTLHPGGPVYNRLQGIRQTDPIEAPSAINPAYGLPFACRYELTELLAARRHGDLYQAIDAASGATVVVRIVRKSAFVDETAIEDFLSRGKSYMNLRRRPFAEIVDVGESDGFCFVVTEFIDGPALADSSWATMEMGHRFRLIDAIDCARELCDAYNYATRAGIDLRIDRGYIILYKSTLRLTDRAILRPRLRTSSTMPKKRDSEGAKQGTPNIHAGLCSIGLVFYELLTDQKPASRPVPLRSLRAEVSPLLQKVVTRLIATNPIDRMESTEPVTAALDVISQALKETPPHSESETDQLPLSPVVAMVLPGSPERTFRVQSAPGRRLIAIILVALLAFSTAIFWILLVTQFPSLPVPLGQDSVAIDLLGTTHGDAGTPRQRVTLARTGGLSTLQSIHLMSSPADREKSIGLRNYRIAMPPVTDALWRPMKPSRSPGNSVLKSEISTFPINQTLFENRYMETRFDVLADESGNSLDRVRLLNGYAYEEFPPAIPDDAAPGLLGSFFPRAGGQAEVDLPDEEFSSIEAPRFFYGDVSMGLFHAGTRGLRSIPELEEVVEGSGGSLPTKLAIPVIQPAFEIGPLVFERALSEERKGIEIKFPLRLSGYSGQALEIGAYIFYADGTAIKDYDGRYVSQRRNVYTKRTLDFTADRFSDDGFVLFLPYTQFDGLLGGTHHLMAQVFIWGGPAFDQRIARGKRAGFDLTLHKFLAEPSRPRHEVYGAHN